MLPNKEGERVPNATFKTRRDGEFVDVTTDDLFKGKRVVVFALPGAYTPTCSATHLPRFNELADTIRNEGIDDIICMSVNDAFVMNEWAKNQDADQVTLIPDGNGEFAEGMGMLVDKSDLGFGKRSWRYSMVVDDGKVEKMFIEPEKPGDPFEVSDADTMLHYLNPQAKAPRPVTIFTKPGCSYCTKAKEQLEAHGFKYEEIELGDELTSRTLRAVSGAGTTPQIFIDGHLIGGQDQLEGWLRENGVRKAS